MQGILDLFFPKRCVGCTRILSRSPLPVCVKCYNEIPFSHWPVNRENPTFETLNRHADIEAASSLMLYSQQNTAKKLVMANKYYNMPGIGEALAELSLEILRPLDIEVITCVPSHSKTLKIRGYNQVFPFAQRLSQLQKTEFNPGLLKRTQRRDSQTHKNREERMHSLGSAFLVSDDIKKYQSILLLDDVLTTGATLSNCCNLMLEKKEIKIYVFTMAKVN